MTKAGVKCVNSAVQQIFVLPNRRGGGGGGGGLSDIFIHTLARVIFWGFIILKFNIFGGFSEKLMSFEYDDFLDIFLGS